MNYASPALLFHEGDHFPGKPDRAEKVLFQGIHDGLVIEFRGTSGGAVAHVGYQDADLAEPVEGVPNHTPDVPGNGKVSGVFPLNRLTQLSASSNSAKSSASIILSSGFNGS